MDPLSVNLADGHFLKVGIALQLTEEVPLEEFGEGELAKAKDLLIAQVGGRPMEELGTPAGRDSLKKELTEKAEETFDGDVMDVYFTDFVMQ
jgi:flagellar FliL protein